MQPSKKPMSAVPPASVSRQRPPQTLREQWVRKILYFYRRFVRLRGSSHAIARGLAAGVFTGMFPLFGLQIVSGVAIAILLRGSKLMAAAGTWISNPITSIPIFIFNLRVGYWVLGKENQPFKPTDVESFQEFLDLGTDIIWTLFVGSFAVGLVCGIISYFVGLWLIERVRQRRIDRADRLARQEQDG
jgi:uncharacterized protein